MKAAESCGVTLTSVGVTVSGSGNDSVCGSDGRWISDAVVCRVGDFGDAALVERGSD